ncbi:MAG: sugar ABC transporter substrate-binding protein [Chloroflexi bacterium]|nr:MAG: sugar ABC transporter substrate-binding protein [Chloroflexota bacterium]
MKARFPLIVSILIILATLLGACAQGAQPTTAPDEPAAQNEPVTIKVVSFLTYDENKEGAEAAVVKAFQAAHPEINVEFQLLPYADYFTSLKTWVVGGTAPDVASLDLAMLQEMAGSGSLVDLNPLVTSTGYDLSAYYNSTLQMFQNKGGQYGLPASYSNVVLYYNKKLFDEAGLPYPTDDMDWDTFVDYAKKLTKDTNGDGNNDIFGTSRLWWPYYLLFNDATPFNADATECTLTDQKAVDGFQAMVDLTLNYKVAPSSKDLAAQDDWHMFEGGRIAMYPIGPWSISEFNDVIVDFDWDAVPLPSGPSGEKATFLFGNAYSILSASKQQEAAFTFMQFVTGAEGDQIRQDAGFEIAPIKSVAEGSFLKAMVGKKPENAKVFLDSAAFAKSVPTHAQWSEISDAISSQLDSALLGDITVPEAMQAACDVINPILAESK